MRRTWTLGSSFMLLAKGFRGGSYEQVGMRNSCFRSLLPGFALAEDPNVDVQVQVVDAMNKVFGFHPGFRAVHSKGIVVKGKFIGTTEGAELSKAELFAGNAIPVTVRFSDNGGVPTRIGRIGRC